MKCAERTYESDFAPFIERHGLTWVGRGNWRTTYRTRSGRYVVKFPYREGGELDNRNEAHTHRHGDPYILAENTARCRLIRVADCDCLVMEWVEPLNLTDPATPVPEWVEWVDCAQVGHTRRGRLVAYDFA